MFKLVLRFRIPKALGLNPSSFASLGRGKSRNPAIPSSPPATKRISLSPSLDLEAFESDPGPLGPPRATGDRRRGGAGASVTPAPDPAQSPRSPPGSLAPLARAPSPWAGSPPHSSEMLPRSAAVAGAHARQQPPCVVPSVLRSSLRLAAPPRTLARRRGCSVTLGALLLCIPTARDAAPLLRQESGSRCSCPHPIY